MKLLGSFKNWNFSSLLGYGLAACARQQLERLHLAITPPSIDRFARGKMFPIDRRNAKVNDREQISGGRPKIFWRIFTIFHKFRKCLLLIIEANNICNTIGCNYNFCADRTPSVEK